MRLRRGLCLARLKRVQSACLKGRMLRQGTGASAGDRLLSGAGS